MPDGPNGEEQDWDELSLERGSRIGEFELREIIGKGGFGIVYLAWDHSLDRVVALKEYMPASLASRKNHSHVSPRSERHRDTYEAGLRSFVNEAKLLAQFDNPALVKVHRFWEANGTAYMVMPYYRGSTLAQTIRALPEPPQEVWLMELLALLTDALIELHAAQCYHRDVAPDNILILEDSGLPLLLDFGAARRVIADQTQALTVILKSGYAPIEQYAQVPGLQQGAWTDVYALASVVYWSVTGKTPPPSVGRMIQDSYVPLAQCAPPQYSAGFAAAIDKALVLMPEQRTRSIASLREDLGLNALTVSRTTKALPWSDPDRTVISTPPPPLAVEQGTQTLPSDGPTITGALHSPAPAAAMGDRPQARARRKNVTAAAVGGVLLLAAVAGWWWAKPEGRVQESSHSAPERSSPPSSPQPSGPPPVAASPQPAPNRPPIPQSAADAVALILEKRDPKLTLGVDVGTAKIVGGVRTRLLTYRSSEAGHFYVMGRQPGRDELQLLLPLSKALPARIETTGSLALPLDALNPGTWELALIVTRQPVDPAEFGWTAEGALWKRRFGADAGPEARRLLPWRIPDCAPAPAICDFGYGAAAFQLEVETVPHVDVAKRAPAPPVEAPPKPTRPSQAPRVEVAGTEAKSQKAPVNPECEKILTRLSLGETGQDLIDRMKTLKCK